MVSPTSLFPRTQSMRVGQGYFAGRMTVLNTLLTLPVCLPTFTTVVQSAYDSVPLIEQDELVILYRSVALRAITNAGGSQELCYQGTRTTIIGDIENFIRGQGGHQCQMMWLSGPVGAGKTTIVQTIAERCDKANIQVATFYFSREDAIRNHAGNLVATLLYQLFVFFPILKQFVRDCLSSNPLILGAPIQDQFMQLISLPLRDIRHPAIVLLVDGLDECDDKTEQQQVLMALHALSMQEHSPFIVLVSSRDEYHLRLSFGKLGPTVTSTILDHDRYRPHDDIYRFVVGKFEEMKKLRPFISHNDWPSVTAIKAITAKSSGQFLYAATVMQYIENSPASPTLSLAWIQGAQLVESHSPLAGLDSKYAFVFSRATNVDFTNHILAAHFLSHRSRQGSQHRLYFVDTLKLYNSRYTCDTIESYISDLTSIIKPVRRPEPGEPLLLSFYHESLGDYLLDESRSGIYYVDVDGFAAELVSGLLQKFHDQSSFSFAVSALSHVGHSTPDLERSLLSASDRRRLFLHPNPCLTAIWMEAIFHIYRIYWNKDNNLYKRILRCWVRFAYFNYIGIDDNLYPYCRRYAAMEGIAFRLRKLCKRA